MTPVEHPSRAALLDFAMGVRASGDGLAVADHLAACPACCATVRLLEESAGELLNSLQGVAMSSDALKHALERIDALADDAQE